nr:MAG TPA: hypothetical protein [Caudoviricetes sp.]
MLLSSSWHFTTFYTKYTNIVKFSLHLRIS